MQNLALIEHEMISSSSGLLLCPIEGEFIGRVQKLAGPSTNGESEGTTLLLMELSIGQILCSCRRARRGDFLLQAPRRAKSSTLASSMQPLARSISAVAHVSSDPVQYDHRSIAALHSECNAAPRASGHTEFARD